MLPRNHPDRIKIAFDDHAWWPMGLLSQPPWPCTSGLSQLVQQRLDLGDAPGAGPDTGDKMMTLVASALAGGDCIDDTDAARSARILGFTGPSLHLGRLPTARWGHVRHWTG